MILLPSEQITGLGGFIDAMKTVFTVYGGEVTKSGAELSGAGAWLGNISAALFILVLLSSGTTWLMGADVSQAVAGYDGAGPRILGTFSSKYGTPMCNPDLGRRRREVLQRGAQRRAAVHDDLLPGDLHRADQAVGKHTREQTVARPAELPPNLQPVG